jgi:hypothetical protein
MLFDLNSLNQQSEKHKAASHTEKCAKYISEQIEGDLSFQIGKLEDGKSYHFDTDARWSLHDLVAYCIRNIGPCDMYFATYAIKEFQARMFTSMLSDGILTSLHGLIDYRTSVHAADAYQLLLKNCTQLGMMRTHAKLVVLIGEKVSLAIAGSANFTTNTRADVGVITCEKSIADYRKNWITKNIQNGLIN